MNARQYKTKAIQQSMEQVNFNTPLKIFFSGILIILLFSSGFSPLPFNEYHYLIETESQLIIAGSSNVSEFTCDCSCERDFTQGMLEMIRRPGSDCIDFTDAHIQLTTANLDCGHKIMNKDLFETLQYKKYPHISITLVQAEIPKGKGFNAINQWSDINAITRISIAGQERDVHFPIKGRKMDVNRFHFTGEASLKMTDFGLNPPRAMLGLIKVDDEISIHLDLVVRVLNNYAVEG